jgi:hypothetical protein
MSLLSFHRRELYIFFFEVSGAFLCSKQFNFLDSACEQCFCSLHSEIRFFCSNQLCFFHSLLNGYFTDDLNFSMNVSIRLIKFENKRRKAHPNLNECADKKSSKHFIFRICTNFVEMMCRDKVYLDGYSFLMYTNFS